MRTSINELLNKQSAEETIYILCDPQVRDFVITAGDFFQLETLDKWVDNSWSQDVFLEKTDQKKQNEIYQRLKEEEWEIVGKLKELKKTDPAGYEHREEIQALRCVKQGIGKALRDMNAYYEAQAEWEMQKTYGLKKRQTFVYKNTVSMGDFSDLEKKFPILQKVNLPWIRECPLFFSDISSIRKSVEEGKTIGIVGGPCLFGTYEVEVIICHKDDREFSYDFSSGRRYDQQPGRMDFADHVERWHEKIQKISFRNRKMGVTVQEQQSLEVLFEFAKAFQAKVAIPIPDISYLKYLYTVLEPLEEKMREQIVLEFRTQTRKIADLYLERIEKLKKKYPQIEVKVLHERDQALCKEFHEKREIYFQKSGLIHRMTSKRKKTDAIFDYISMLALPFYFWGTEQVIQIDNLDETDSYRKCKKVHQSAFTLSSILYPERLSKNLRDTIFNAPLEDKEYLETTGE